jgi:hypothetical protein
MTYDVLRSNKPDADPLRKYKIPISVKLPIYVVEQIEGFRARHQLRDRSSAISQLIETALYVERKMGLAENWTADDVQEIKKQFETGEMVDWVASLSRDQFNAMYNVLKTENDIRSGQRRLP